MKNYVFLLLYLLSFALPSSAQKIKDKRVTINFVALPAEKLPLEYNTYSVQVYGANASIAGLSTEVLTKNVRMDGFKRVESSQNEYGHLRVSVNTGTMSSGRPELKSKTTTTKDDKGVEKKTTTYWYAMSCSASTSFRILNPEGTVLASGSDSHNEVMTTSEYASSSALNKEYNPLIEELRRKFASQVSYRAVSAAHTQLRNKYDFAFTSDDPQFYYIKKHPAEDQFEANMEKTKEIFSSLKPATPPEEGLKKMASIIDFWKKYGDTNPGTDKDLIEVYVACNSNLANTYFYLDQFDEAEKYAKRILQADPKDKRTSRLLELMAKTRKSMELHDIHTMHYHRDLTNAIAPTKVKAVENEKEQMQDENNSLAGFILFNNDSIKGFFMRPKEDTEFVFGPNGNTKFVSDSRTAVKEYDMSSADVKAFAIGDRNFSKISFSPCAKGKTVAGMHIMEELYRSDKIRLYKYYPLSGALGNEQYEFAYKKAAETEPVSLLDTKFLLWEKGLGNYFSDCEDLKVMCASGGFKLQETDLIKAARIYTEVCN